MGIMTIFKNKKAFSLVELIIAMILASIVMLSVYFMLMLVYGQFNDLSEESERFNNLQVFEKMFQRSAMTCSYYKIQGSTFYFYNSNGTYEEYTFNISNKTDFSNITKTAEKIKKYYNTLEDNDVVSNDNKNNNYMLTYFKKSGSLSYTGTGGTGNAGYMKTPEFPLTEDTEEEKVLFDNIVKVYYETSKGLDTASDFGTFTGKSINSSIWQDNGFKKIYTPFIKLIIIYKDNEGRLKRSIIACRLRGIEGVEIQL